MGRWRQSVREAEGWPAGHGDFGLQSLLSGLGPMSPWLECLRSGYRTIPYLEKGKEYISPLQANHCLVPGSHILVTMESCVPIAPPTLSQLQGVGLGLDIT